MNKHVAEHNSELAKVKEKLNETQELLEEEIHSKTTLETELKHKINSILKDTDHDKRILKNECSKLEHDQISLFTNEECTLSAEEDCLLRPERVVTFDALQDLQY